MNAALAAEWIWTQFRPVVVVVRRDLRNVLASWNALGFRGPGEAAFAPIAAEARRRWDVDFAPGDDGLSRSAALCAVMTAALHDDAAPAPETQAQPERQSTRGMLLAALALMAGIVLRRWGADQR